MTSASKVILITGASSGFGALTARKLALAGHTVYASMQAATTRNAKAVKAASDFAEEHTVSLRMVELNVTDTASANAAIAQVAQGSGRLDVIVDNVWSYALRTRRVVYSGANVRLLRRECSWPSSCQSGCSAIHASCWQRNSCCG